MLAKEFIERYGEHPTHVKVTNRNIPDKPTGDNMWMLKEDFLLSFGDLEVDVLNGDFVKYNENGLQIGIYNAFISSPICGK